MPKEYSPFTPEKPVPIDFFVGRENEVKDLMASAEKSVAMKSLESKFVIGERGIGKSSLCKYASVAAERNLKVLGLHVFLGGVTTLEEMIRRIFERLLKESIERPWYDSIKQFLGNHIREVGLFGISVEFDASERDLARAVSDFVPALRNLLKKLQGQRQGILLILDDLNGLSSSDQFANWLKSMVDEIATGRDPLPLTLVLVGLPERRKQLIERQPSLDRVFNLLKIDRFDEEETKEFYQRTFNRVNVKITKEALVTLWQFSGGYPVFMHELGDAVFKIDEDNQIDGGEALAGIFRGIQIIGEKYLEPKVISAIRSDKYKNILKKIGTADFTFKFTRKNIVKNLSLQESKVLDNFLRRLKELNVIRSDPEHGQGSYEFISLIFYWYFRIQSI